MDRKVVLAIDPGHRKCGLALVARNAQQEIELIWHTVAPVEDIEATIDEARAIENFSLIIIGNGTASSKLIDRFRNHLPAIGVLSVDEKDTTLEARERYWLHHPRKGWRRLFPSSLQIPPEPYDDFAAYVLAERLLLGS